MLCLLELNRGETAKLLWCLSALNPGATSGLPGPLGIDVRNRKVPTLRRSVLNYGASLGPLKPLGIDVWNLAGALEPLGFEISSLAGHPRPPGVEMWGITRALLGRSAFNSGA